VNFLNNPPSGNWLHDIAVAAKPSLEELLADAQVVFRCLADYRSTHELSAADKDGKLTAEFWKCRERLNKKLAKLIRAPQVDLEEVFDGTRISWVSMIKDTEEPTTALLSQQIQWVVQLIAQGAILNVRRCQECTKWYFARFSHQEFCSSSCRGKHFAKTEDFRQKRRDYMRDYYRRKKSENFK